MTDHTLTLSDGRTLGFASVGDPSGVPVMFFHGTPGCRLTFPPDESLGTLPGIRLIAPERPGYGLSDPQAGRTLLGWADDVVELADHLGLGEFAVGGVSGGGPHALACAYRLPARVTRVLLVSSPAPAVFRGATRGMGLGNKLGVWLGDRFPGLVRKTINWNAAAFRKHPEASVRSMARQMAKPDRALLDDPAYLASAVRENLEAYRQGGAGHVAEAGLVMTRRGWGFPLDAIATPVDLWHGLDDVLVTVNMAEYLQRELPNCTARFVAGAGHLLLEHPVVLDEIQVALTGAFAPRSSGPAGDAAAVSKDS